MKKGWLSVAAIVLSFLAGCATAPPYSYQPVKTDEFDEVGKYCYQNDFLEGFNENAKFFETYQCRYLSGEIKAKTMESLYLMYGSRNNFKPTVYLKGKYYACLDSHENKQKCKTLNERSMKALDDELEKEKKDILYQTLADSDDVCVSRDLKQLMLIKGQTCSLKNDYRDESSFKAGYFEYAKANKLDLKNSYESAYNSYTIEAGH